MASLSPLEITVSELAKVQTAIGNYRKGCACITLGLGMLTGAAAKVNHVGLSVFLLLLSLSFVALKFVWMDRHLTECVRRKVNLENLREGQRLVEGLRPLLAKSEMLKMLSSAVESKSESSSLANFAAKGNDILGEAKHLAIRQLGGQSPTERNTVLRQEVQAIDSEIQRLKLSTMFVTLTFEHLKRELNEEKPRLKNVALHSYQFMAVYADFVVSVEQRRKTLFPQPAPIPQ